MKYSPKKDAVLVLQDGTVFYGKSAGKVGTVSGEICFNTGMTGYQEIFTDPSYYGQIMVMTNAHIGNYGVHEEEVESDNMKIKGLICKDFNDQQSRHAANGSLKSYYEEQGMVAISDVDTRALVRYVRDRGAMNVIISSEITDIAALKEQLQNVPSMEGLELSSKVSTKVAYTKGDENSSMRVAVLDLGVKRNILKCMTDRGCFLKVFPWDTKAEEILAWNPNGIFLSNGPGDPGVMTEVIENAKDLLNAGLPVFGICLGHQIISLASGLKTFKMHNGHRGINHPVINLATGKCEVTSQNHGFAVSPEGIDAIDNIELTHKNLNDDTVEGIRLTDRSCFSVQYHPESSPGPHDSRYLFDQFVDNINQFLN